MSLKTTEQYLESLRDGREIYWDGDRIEDVTADPRFAVPLAMAGRDYAYDDPEHGALRRYETEEGGVANRIFQVPRTTEDLQRRLAFSRTLSHVTGVSGVFMALLTAKDEIARVNPDYAANIERIYRYARDNDLRGAEVISDPKGDRKRRAQEQDDPDLYVRIVDRTAEGIVVRGAKLHITAASLVHELVVMPTKGMKQEEADYAVSFSIPVNTPGVKIINRSVSMSRPNPFDYPASAHHSMPEGFVIFDDVLVPWDRVFLAGEIRLASTLARSLGLWERTVGVIEAVRQSELLVGLAQLVSEMQGKERDPLVLASIADLIAYHELLRMGLEYSVEHPQTTPSGMIHPNTLAINVAKYHYAANYHAMVAKLHDVSGGLVVTLPGEKDLRNEATGKYMRKYLHTRDDVDVEDRMRVYNMIRDFTADAYGGWAMVAALQGGGGLAAQRFMMNMAFDMERARAAARRASGIV
ncbi:MAG: 4-hydroxyphenylacetate 3-hydroxylase N-terminal domain-containing protein [Sphingobium sp.]